MFFGEVPVADAGGHILGHSLAAGPVKFRKGRVLSAEDVQALRQAGVAAVTIARLSPDDVGEDVAAGRISEPLTTGTLRASEPFTGRVNLFATADGLVIVSPAAVNRLNAIDESMTIATLAQDTVVRKGQMVATIKIIPFAVAEDLVQRWVSVARQELALDVRAFGNLTAGMVLSGTGQLKPSVIDKTINATRERLSLSGSRMLEPLTCDHDAASVAAAITRLVDAGCDLVLASGLSAIVDRQDVIPSAIISAGGEIIHFGMPVDPGNLMLLGHIRRIPVIGLPGCARSPKLNGFDWILNRCAAGVGVTSQDIMEMGVGGLLTEGARPMPRNARKKDKTTAGQNIAALVLAAGQSRRMGTENKLLKLFDGKPLIQHTVGEILQAPVRKTTVVTGYQEDLLRAALAEMNVATVHCPDYASGLSASLKAGLQAIDPDCDGVLICLADMPFLTATHIGKLVAAFDPVEGREICLPTFKGKRGNPVLWSRRFIEDMQGIKGDTGARHLIGENADVVVEIAMDDDGVLIDLDSPEAWQTALNRMRVK
ncbi:MAG: molybdopterin-binding/glycosyltransferase family 2 protein [Rhodospirillales bacterium]